MTTLIVVLAIVNLGLGVGIAILHDRFYARPSVVAVPAPVQSEKAEPRNAPPSVAMNYAPIPAPDGRLPAHWRSMLSAFSLEDVGILEAAQWVCVRQCDEVRQHLTRADTLQRSLNADDFLPQHEFDRVLLACQRWRDNLKEALRQIEKSDIPDYHATRFDQVLGDYLSQLTVDLQALEDPDAVGPNWLNSRRREVLQRVLETTYRLRDEIYEHLAVELQSQNRAANIAAHLRVDAEMACYNRVGLEYLVAGYQATYDPSRGPTAVALIDVDRFRRIHQELGAAQSDALLAVFGELAERALRHNRGFDRAARIGGHSFAFFLGYTTLNGAQLVCERLRQQVEAASFVIGERELELTVSCSAVELHPEETMAQALKRLRSGLAEARKAGRNRTCLVDGQQQTIVQPTQIKVTGQTIAVPCATAV